MENLIKKKEYKKAWELIVKVIEEDPEGKEELREIFSFLLTTYW